jgi:hypothetical protein
LHCPRFPLISSITQQQQQQQPHSQPIKNPPSSFSKFFISSGKQGGGATVLGEGCDIVTRETCVPTSFSEGKQLQKSSCAAFCLCPLLQWGPCQTQPADYWVQLCLCQVLIIHSPHQPTTSSFSQSFIYSGKQGGGATVLRMGH